MADELGKRAEVVLKRLETNPSLGDAMDAVVLVLVELAARVELLEAERNKKAGD